MNILPQITDTLQQRDFNLFIDRMIIEYKFLKWKRGLCAFILFYKYTYPKYFQLIRYHLEEYYNINEIYPDRFFWPESNPHPRVLFLKSLKFIL